MSAKSGFRYDTSDVEWRDFITDGCFYKLLNVDLEARQADMLVKFEPRSECLYHRHAATTTTLVLEGELCIRERTAAGESLKVKGPGSYSVGGEGEVHIEGSNQSEPTVVFFSFRSRDEVIYELLNADLSLRRRITVADFERDWREKWPEEGAR